MDPTLWQMIKALYEVVADRDHLRARVAELEQQAEQHSRAQEQAEFAAPKD